MTRKTLLLAICFLALALFLEGRFGLIAAVAIFVAWWGLALPRRALWGSAVLLLAAAPVVLIIQGLPRSTVAGAGFGVQHMLAHRLVVLSLTIAALAAFADLLDLDMTQRRRPSSRRRLDRYGEAVGAVPAQPPDRDELGPDRQPPEPLERPKA
jgi:hypothetical protein